MYMHVHADGCECSFHSHQPLTIGFFFQIPFKKEKKTQRKREFILNLNLPFLIRSIHVILCFSCRFVFPSVLFSHTFVFIKHMRMLSTVPYYAIDLFLVKHFRSDRQTQRDNRFLSRFVIKNLAKHSNRKGNERTLFEQKFASQLYYQSYSKDCLLQISLQFTFFKKTSH